MVVVAVCVVPFTGLRWDAAALLSAGYLSTALIAQAGFSFLKVTAPALRTRAVDGKLSRAGVDATNR